jgi:hypothetical protein
MGERQATLSVKADGAALTGTQAAEGNSAEIFDGRVNGDTIAWKVSITNPMQMTVEFSGTVKGDGTASSFSARSGLPRSLARAHKFAFDSLKGPRAPSVWTIDFESEDLDSFAPPPTAL